MINIPASLRIFSSDSFHRDSAVWQQSLVLMWKKNYSEDAVANAIRTFVKNNDSFGISFVNNSTGSWVKISPFQNMQIPVAEFNSLEEVFAFAKEEANRPLQTDGALYRASVVRAEGKIGAVCTVHHALIDGYSGVLFIKGVSDILNGKPSPQSTILHHLEEEHKYTSTNKYNKDLAFWNQYLHEHKNNQSFFRSQGSGAYDSFSRWFSFPEPLCEKVLSLCKESGLTESAFWYAAIALFLSRRLNRDHFNLGISLLNRITKTDYDTFGLFMHIVPLGVSVNACSFNAFAEQISDSLMTLIRHQKLSAYSISQNCNEVSSRKEPLFDVAVDYSHMPVFEGLEYQIIYSGTCSVPLEIHLFRNVGQGLRICFRFSRMFFNTTRAKDFENAFPMFVFQLIELSDTNKLIQDVSVLEEDERHQLLHTFNDTALPYNKNKSVYDLILEQAEREPGKTAVIATDRTLSYAQLREEAGRVAKGLLDRGITAGDIVAFRLPRDSRLLCAMLGILQTGAAYLPLDPQQPEERLAYILKDSRAKLCVTEETYAALLATEALQQPVSVKGNDLCYCIYTSGSTGAPKGTLLTQQNVLNYIGTSAQHMNGGVISSDCKTVLSVTSVGFDIFVTESLLPLANGKTIVLADEQQSQFGTELQRLLQKYSVDMMQTTPSKMHVFLQSIPDRTCLQQMQCIVLGGETLDKSLVEELAAYTPAKIWNVYGPTEATVWATFTEVKHAEEITIGKPMANTQIYILDKYLQPVPIGVTGELCIAGDCVGEGYLNRPELTKEKFVDNPFGEGKLYKTGDLAYWREDGNVVFVGRNDFQIKINGQRIELGEIEAAMSALDGIESAAVTVRKDENDRQLLCAFYTGKETAGTELRGLLAHSLPRYMIPQIFMHLDQMPLNTSGKINRKALPDVSLDTLETTTVYVAPQTEAEAVLISSVMQVLHNNHIGMLDNFFDLGGDSLKSIAWISLLEQQGYTLSAEDIFNSIDMAAIAKKLRETEPEDETDPDYPKRLPLTAAQKEVYTAQAIVPDKPVYNISYIIRVQSLDVQKLQGAVDCMLQRHEILRSYFENTNGELTQVADENAHCTVEPIIGNITDLIRPFDLSKAPLIRVGYQDNTVVFDLHHIVADGSSMPVFFRELNEFYMGRTPKSSFRPYKYFAATQAIRPEDEAYWNAQFADGVPALTIRTDLPRPSVRTYTGETLYHQLPKATDEKISDFCRAQGITPFVYYYGAFQILLQKFSGLEDLVVGTPVSGRTAKNLHTIGMFVHTLPLRCKPEGNKTIKQFFREVRDLSLESARHTDAAISAVAASRGKASLFDVMFTYQAEEMITLDFGDKPAEIVPVSLPVSKYDFDFTLYPHKAGAVLAATYSTDLFQLQTMERMMCAYEKILTEVLDANKTIRDISVMEAYERHQLLHTFNDTATPYDQGKSVYDLFLQQVQKASLSVQIKDESTEYSFAQLDSDASKVDAFIRNTVGSKKQVIGVLCDRSYSQLAVIFGIVRGGNAYLPISPQYPPERIRTMLETSGCDLVLSQKQYLYLTDKACDVEAHLQAALPEPVPSPAAMPQDILYVIYTSGSTGTPKGAMVSNRSAINRIQWMANRFFDETSVVMLKTPYTFDVSVWEIFGFAMCGFSLYILPPEEHYRQSSVLSYIERGQVTDLHFVPTVFDQFIAVLKKEKDPQTKLRSLRHVILSGESLSAHAINSFRQYHSGQVTMYNLYGPAECSVDVTAYACAETETDPVPIGKPIDNTQIYITDQYMQLVPIGVTGELCIAGDCVGAGYLNRPELTKEKFVDNPFSEGKLYKTGDLAYWREDGNVVFVGRNDFQVKINGQRVELGEIEAAMSGIDGIESAAVIVRKDENDRQLLCAFYTGKETAGTELRGLLAHSLPRYMIPQIFMHLDQMPLNTSGKINRKALESEPVETETQSFEAPITPQEKVLATTIAEVLGITQVSRNDNFFSLGGDSIRAIHVVSELQSQGYMLRVANLMRGEVLRETALRMQEIEQAQEEDLPFADPSLQQSELDEIRARFEENAEDAYSLSPAQEGIYAQSLKNEGKHVYHLQQLIRLSEEDPKLTKEQVAAIAQRHAALRTAFVTMKSTGRVLQVVLKDRKPDYQLIPLNTPYKEETAKTYLLADAEQPFDLEKDPLLRIRVLRFQDTDIILCAAHHIVTDGWSMTLLAQEVFGNKEHTEAVTFAKHVRTLQTLDEKEALIYWRQLLQGAAPLHLFATGQRAVASADHPYETLEDHVQTEATEQLAKQLGITVNTVFESAFGLLLGQYTGTDDAIFCKAVSGRSTAVGSDYTVGPFLNTVPVRIAADREESGDALLRRVQQQGLCAERFGNLSLASVYAEGGLRGEEIDALFAFENYYYSKAHENESERLSSHLLYYHEQTEFPLSTTVFRQGNEYILRFVYHPSVFTKAQIEALAASYRHLLIQLTAKPQAALADIRTLTLPQQQTIRSFSTGPSVVLPDKTAYDLIQQQTEKRPDKTAVIATDRTLTYAQLREEAGRVAKGLLDRGITAGDIVAFRLPRDSRLLCAMLGILQTGAAYLPLDPQQPEERLAYILKDSRAKLCVTEETYAALLATEALQQPVSVKGNDLCYCIYTSGSTGAPKGTLLTQRNVCNYLNNLKSLYGTEICMPLYTSVAVDLTVTSIFLPLVTGGYVHCYDGELQKILPRLLSNNRITALKATPVHLKLMFAEQTGSMEQLRHLIVGGEALYNETVKEATICFGSGVRIHNEYGPTETTVGCMDYVCDPIKDAEATPIGKPMANTQIYILDKYLQPVPIGVTGELCIAGDCVGEGYLNRPELTKEKFVDNPFSEGKLYKTGDLAYWREDGNVVFVGRNDFQIKINGQRIELGEIEAAMSALDGIESAAVTVRKDENDRQLLCAFYTGKETAGTELRGLLAHSLPRYMIPQIFMHLDQMPLNTSGKINRKALESEPVETETQSFEAPITPQEKVLATTIAEVLGITQVSRNDNFFSLGGDSIRAIHVASELQNSGWSLRIPDILRADTIAALAEKITNINTVTDYAQPEETDFVPLPPVARAYLQRKPHVPDRFSQSCILQTTASPDEVKAALVELIRRHSILRAVLQNEVLRILPESAAENALHFAVHTVFDENALERVKQSLSSLDVRFDLTTGPLVDAAFCVTPNGNVLRWTVHHFVIDLFSWEVLLTELQIILQRQTDPSAPELPNRTADYGQWIQALNQYKVTMPAQEKTFWEQLLVETGNVVPLISDADPLLPGEEVQVTLENNVTAGLLQLEQKENVRLDALLLAALGRAATRLTEGTIGICVESHGRTLLPTPVRIERTVGWFTAIYPVIIEQDPDVTQQVFDVRRKLQSVPKNGIGWLLRYEMLPQNASLMFNFYRYPANGALQVQPVNPMDTDAFDALFPGVISVDCSLSGNEISAILRCPTLRRRPTLLKKLADGFLQAAEEIATETNFAGQRADAADAYNDNALTYGELSVLDAIFNGVDENE